MVELWKRTPEMRGCAGEGSELHGSEPSEPPVHVREGGVKEEQRLHAGM